MLINLEVFLKLWSRVQASFGYELWRRTEPSANLVIKTQLSYRRCANIR
jgi:hypothetical protein